MIHIDSNYEYLIKKKTCFENERRRIIDEKLKDVIHESVDNYDKYGFLYDDLNKYEEMRNKVAHCEEDFKEDYAKENYKKLVFSILQVIFVVGMGEEISGIFKIE